MTRRDTPLRELLSNLLIQLGRGAEGVRFRDRANFFYDPGPKAQARSLERTCLFRPLNLSLPVLQASIVRQRV